MKMLTVFEKTGAARFIGHLDLQRAMQRALRRSGLPVRYSQGFNPHLLLSFASPLSVGTEGLREIMEVPLSDDVAEASFLARLNVALPQGLKASLARALPDDAPAAMARLHAARYAIRPMASADTLLAAAPAFLAQETIPFLRKTKSGERMDDLRPLILALQAEDGALRATLSCHERGTAKPEQLVAALAAFSGLPAPRCRVTREGLLDRDMRPLEGL